jgi:hypothetical protein
MMLARILRVDSFAILTFPHHLLLWTRKFCQRTGRPVAVQLHSVGVVVVVFLNDFFPSFFL